MEWTPDHTVIACVIVGVLFLGLVLWACLGSTSSSPKQSRRRGGGSILDFIDSDDCDCGD